MNLVLSSIKTLLSDSINTGKATTDNDYVKSFYQGEVFLVPQSYLPAIMVIGKQTRQSAHGTGKDQAVYSITIRCVVDVKREFTEDGTGDIIKSQQTLMDLMEERDSSTGVASATSVLGILRRNIRVDGKYLFNNDSVINYQMMPKGQYFYVAADMSCSFTTDLVLRS